MGIIYDSSGVMTGHKTLFLIKIDHFSIYRVRLNYSLVKINSISIFYQIPAFITMRVMTGITTNGFHEVPVANFLVDAGHRVHIMAFNAQV